jgi:L-alanine-DL-glutamate epimerase-like enolase superfamily enzyme
LTRPYSIAYKTVDSVENVFVYLETGSGVWGIGSGSPAPFVTGETDEMCKNVLLENAQRLLLGKDIRQLSDLCRTIEREFPKTPAARCALDIALHDAFAKHLEIPLVDLLGRAHTSLSTSITIGIKDAIEETFEEADEYLGRGFKSIKLKIGKNVAQDIETTLKLQERIGKHMRIRVDANQGYSAADLQKYFHATQYIGLELIEQPLKKEHPELMLEVEEAIRKTCAGDETIQRPADALRYAAHPRPFGIYNIKLMKCGGIFPAMQIAGIANLAGIQLMWGCMDESIISITAALHAALASRATSYLDLDGSLDLARDIVNGGFILKDGMLSVSNKPGLGVDFNFH